MYHDLFFKDNFEELKYLFSKKPFVLFIGAGVNIGFNEQLSWDGLLNYLVERAWNILRIEEGLHINEKDKIDKLLKDFSPYQKAMFIKKILGNNYIGFLQSHLYSNCNKQVIREEIIHSKTQYLIEIAKFIIKNENIHAVVTYNYDNFLSETIKLLLDTEKQKEPRKIETVDIYQTIQHLAHDNTTLPIYHVHGFIPPPDKILVEKSENVVLATDEYFNNMIEPFSWQTTTQLFYLNNYNCLFLGTSLDDWNMLRALAYSNHFSKAVQHFVLFTSNHSGEGKEVSTFMNRIKASVFEDIGIKPVYTDTADFEELNKLLIKLQPIKKK
jgi:hypothetical protein